MHASYNLSSANDWNELLVPEIERQQAQGKRVAFRADAAFARPAIYEALEARGVQYAIRIPANKSLEREIEDIQFRSPGRHSRTPLVRYKNFQYQADSWTTPRRVGWLSCCARPSSGRRCSASRQSGSGALGFKPCPFTFPDLMWNKLLLNWAARGGITDAHGGSRFWVGGVYEPDAMSNGQPAFAVELAEVARRCFRH